MFENTYQALMFYFRFRAEYPLKSSWRTQKSKKYNKEWRIEELILLATDIERAIKNANLTSAEFEFLRLYFEGWHTYHQMARELNKKFNLKTDATKLYNLRRKLIRKVGKELKKLGLLNCMEA